MQGRSTRKSGQTATEYMLIISVVVIAVVAAAYKFVPLFQDGVNKLGNDVKDILSTGQLGSRGGGGSGMGASDSARVASRPCDGSLEALRYEAMFDPPPCEVPKVAPWKPSFDAALAFQSPALRPLHDEWIGASGGNRAKALIAPRHASLPAPVDASPGVCREDPVVYLSSARLGRRSRSRNR